MGMLAEPAILGRAFETAVGFRGDVEGQAGLMLAGAGFLRLACSAFCKDFRLTLISAVAAGDDEAVHAVGLRRGEHALHGLVAFAGEIDIA